MFERIKTIITNLDQKEYFYYNIYKKITLPFIFFMIIHLLMFASDHREKFTFYVNVYYNIGFYLLAIMPFGVFLTKLYYHFVCLGLAYGKYQFYKNYLLELKNYQDVKIFYILLYLIYSIPYYLFGGSLYRISFSKYYIIPFFSLSFLFFIYYVTPIIKEGYNVKLGKEINYFLKVVGWQKTIYKKNSYYHVLKDTDIRFFKNTKLDFNSDKVYLKRILKEDKDKFKELFKERDLNKIIKIFEKIRDDYWFNIDKRVEKEL